MLDAATLAPVAVEISGWVMPALAVLFLFGVFLRAALYFPMRALFRFLLELERRVYRRLSDPNRGGGASFVLVLHKLLEVTLQEHFHPGKLPAGGPGLLERLGRRIFRVEATAELLAARLNAQAKVFRLSSALPRFSEVARFLLSTQPGLTRVTGLSTGIVHRWLTALPSVLVLGSAFTVFLGVAGMLPAFAEAGVSADEQLLKIWQWRLSLLLVGGAAGIAMAGVIVVLNTLFDAEKMFHSAVVRLGGALEVLWQDVQPALSEEASSGVSMESETTGLHLTKESAVAVESPAGVRPVSSPELTPYAGMPPEPPVFDDDPPEPADPAAELSPDQIRKMTALPPGWGEDEQTSSEAPAPIPPKSPPAPSLWGADSEAVDEDRLAVLEHRLGVIDQYIQKAAEDRMHGLMSEEMWHEESERWSREKERLANEVTTLKRKRDNKAA